MDGFRSVLRPASRLVFHSVSRSVPRFALRFIPSLASPFVSPLGPFSPFRSSPRLSPSPSFRLSVWACRVGGSWGRAVLFCSSGAGGRLCFFSCPGVVAAIGRGGRAVSLMGSVLRMSCRGRLCVMRAMPCGGAWGVLLGEALGGAWWRLWDMGITRRMAGRWGREG